MKESLISRAAILEGCVFPLVCACVPVTTTQSNRAAESAQQRRNIRFGRTMLTVFEVKKEIPAEKTPLPVRSLWERGATLRRGTGTLFCLTSILLLLCAASAPAQQDF